MYFALLNWAICSSGILLSAWIYYFGIRSFARFLLGRGHTCVNASSLKIKPQDKMSTTTSASTTQTILNQYPNIPATVYKFARLGFDDFDSERRILDITIDLERCASYRLQPFFYPECNSNIIGPCDLSASRAPLNLMGPNSVDAVNSDPWV